MKKISLFLALVMALTCVCVSAADYNFTVNGTAVTYDEAPFTEGETLYVPIRAICEALGANVFWDGETQTILVTSADETYAMQVDRTTLHKNNDAVEMTGAVKKVNSRTFITLESVKLMFNVDCVLDAETNEVTIADVVEEEATEEKTEEATDETATEETADENTEENSEEVVDENAEEDVTDEIIEENIDEPVEDELVEEPVEDEFVEEPVEDEFVEEPVEE